MILWYFLLFSEENNMSIFYFCCVFHCFTLFLSIEFYWNNHEITNMTYFYCLRVFHMCFQLYFSYFWRFFLGFVIYFQLLFEISSICFCHFMSINRIIIFNGFFGFRCQIKNSNCDFFIILDKNKRKKNLRYKIK